MFRILIKGIVIWFLFLFISLLIPQANAAEVNAPVQVEVILKRVYLDGEVSEERLTETVWSMEHFWLKYEQWELIDTYEKGLVFKKPVDDISPLLKANGFFGITEDGTLTIFNGRPHQTNIIQSFFQINIEKLESRKHLQLKKGIPIKTKDRYVNVLETFKPYYMPVKTKQ
ncbi:BofC C-terminal domain-containing protein [Bacillus sp. CGMCC 1.16607]|uniref:BofC C-terminal domain-containing protein n=1 Tax=Bacillus sp. CGMCC 1.16607 TaxID=3351842 RepID=UPI003638C702